MALMIDSRSLYVLTTFLGLWASHAWSRTLNEASLREQHRQWMTQFGRAYADEAEKERRFATFKTNVDYIENFNRDGSKPYRLGINGLADLTNEEFQASRNGYRPTVQIGSSRTSSFGYENTSMVPSSIDWRQKGAVTPIKDQGQCGCCWAFSTVAAVEGIHQLSTGKLISLSEQELVDCDTEGENQGCNGGLMDNAFDFIIKNGGLTTEASYPYQAVDGTCNANQAFENAATITSYKDVPTNSESALLNAVANQPVSVAIDASGDGFRFYQSGVFTGECGTNLDHGVTLVGYGTADDGTKFWLVKNSWGTDWGEDGYIRMERDIDANEGLCGIAMKASYPIA